MQHSTTTQQCSTAVQHSTTTQQCSTAHQPPYSPPFLLTLESLSLAQTVSDLGMRLRGDLPTERAGLPDWCANPLGDRRECSAPSSCRNSKTARNLFRVSVLCSAPSSSRYRGANPLGDHRESGRPPTCSELACCGRRPPRVVIVVPTRGSAPSSSRDRGASSGFDFLLVSAIVVQTVGLADWVSLPNPHSCRYRGTNPGFDVLLELLSWCQPLLESLSMVQTGGETLGGKWLCVFPSILWQMVVCVTVHTVRIRVSGWGVEPGGK